MQFKWFHHKSDFHSHSQKIENDLNDHFSIFELLICDSEWRRWKNWIHIECRKEIVSKDTPILFYFHFNSKILQHMILKWLIIVIFTSFFVFYINWIFLENLSQYIMFIV